MADSQEDSLYDDVSAMADRLKLTGRDRTQYIHEHMTRSGYRAVPTYVKDDEEEEDDSGSGSSFFGGRRRRPTRDQESGGHGTRTRRQRDDDDWY